MPTVIFARKVSASAIPPSEHITATEYLHRMGVPDLPPRTSPVDPGYDPSTVEGHLDQSANLIEILKISMSCWIIADENVTRRKVAAAATHSVPTVIGADSFQIAAAHGQFEAYLELCTEFGVARVEYSENFADLPESPSQLVQMARARGLEVQFELGSRSGLISPEDAVAQGSRWLDAGAVQLAAKRPRGTGYFDHQGRFDPSFPERLVRAFGVEAVTFSATDAATQFAILRHFGREVHLCDVKLEDLLNVETYRRGLHSAAFTEEQSCAGLSKQVCPGGPE